jgi:hypothetical protein
MLRRIQPLGFIETVIRGMAIFLMPSLNGEFDVTQLMSLGSEVVYFLQTVTPRNLVVPVAENLAHDVTPPTPAHVAIHPLPPIHTRNTPAARNRNNWRMRVDV